MMKLFLTLLSATLFFGSSVQALTLDCTITKYNNSEHFNETLLESWIPRKQTHVLDLEYSNAHYNEAGYDGEVDYIDDERIHWRYYDDTLDVNKVKYRATYKYILIRKNKRLTPTVEINNNYVEMDGVSGTCEERP